ncbi:methyltransferase domain-containing protein [Candidatus Omnitrophota bacterium]
MMIKISTQNKIRDSFSRAASQYDTYTLFHQRIGERLIGQCGDVGAGATILDVGMGTGVLTHKMAQRYSEAVVIGCDFAELMVEQAKRYETFKAVNADAHALPCETDSVDIVYSNLAYQWVDELKDAFVESKRVLKPGRTFAASLFGYNTFQELFASLCGSASETLKEKVNRMQRLYRCAYVEDRLNAAGFKAVDVSTEKVQLTFEDLFDLIRWNKLVGSNVLACDFNVGKEWLINAQEYYKDHFSNEDNSVYATAEIIWIKART